jgi:hypothetical protein
MIEMLINGTLKKKKKDMSRLGIPFLLVAVLALPCTSQSLMTAT